MVIVETPKQFEEFYEKARSNRCIVVPVFSDLEFHPTINSVSLLYVWFWDESAYILPFNHSQAINLDSEYLGRLGELSLHNGQQFVVAAKALLHHIPWTGAVDLKAVEWTKFGTLTDETDFVPLTMRRIYNQFRAYPNLNRVVPLMVLASYCEAVADHYLSVLDGYDEELAQEMTFYHGAILPVCTFIERAGIRVDIIKYLERFGEKTKKNIADGLVYTELNPFTSAGRITSRFGGVNYSGLSNSDGSRLAIVSRFEKGRMVHIDFESFHVRLIADLIGFTLPSGSVHEYFGRQYFQKEELTPDEYAESKQITFRYLYSKTRDGAQYPFFKAVYDFVDTLWGQIQATGLYVTPKGRKLHLNRIPDPNPGKVFNYFLQMIEMEAALTGIQAIMPLFDGKQSKLVLYTYDAVLLDFNPTDGLAFLQQIVSTLEEKAGCPVRIYQGKSYGELSNITSVIKT